MNHFISYIIIVLSIFATRSYAKCQDTTVIFKSKFLIDECVIEKGKDPWQTHIFKIVEIGNYSYSVLINPITPSYILFKDQYKYRSTTCPKWLQ